MVIPELTRTGRIRSWLYAVLAACTCACAADHTSRPGEDPRDASVDSVAHDARDSVAQEADAEPSGPRFIDARSCFTSPEDVDAWFDLIAELESDFDAICGDTFCEGEYSNYESLRLRCSVEERTGTVGTCVWIFGASNEEIDPASGSVAVQGEVFTCEMPIAPETDIRELVATLLAPGVQAIRAALPGSKLSFFDGLVDCL